MSRTTQRMAMPLFFSVPRFLRWWPQLGQRRASEETGVWHDGQVTSSPTGTLSSTHGVGSTALGSGLARPWVPY